MAETYSPTSILGKLLNERLTPWLTADLSRYADAIGKPFQQVLELAQEVGEQGHETLPVVRNLIYNPSFEYDKVGSVPQAWFTYSPPNLKGKATAIVRSGSAFRGNHYLEVTTAGVEAEEGVATEENIPCTQGVPLKVYAYLRGSGVKVAFGVGSVSNGITEIIHELTGGWVQYEAKITPKHTGYVQAVISTEAMVKAVFELDAISTTATYVDGETEGYFWTGAIGNSPSRTNTFMAGWSRLLNPESCPGKYLPYLAMFVGVQIPITATEAEARELVKNESGLERGTQSAIEMAIIRVLGMKTPFTLIPRTNPKAEEKGYYFLVIIPHATGKEKELKEAIESVKPGGVMFEIIEKEGTWFVGTKKWSEVAAGKKWSAIKEGEY